MSYQNKIIVPLNMVYFLDLGLLYTVDKKYHNEQYFNFSLMKKTNDVIMKHTIGRISENPLTLLLNLKYRILADSLRKQLMDEELQTIINFSPSTAIYDMIVTGKKMSNLLNTSIVCRNELEKQIINNDKSMEGITILDEYEYEGYDSIFIHDIYDIIPNIPNLKGKNIIVSNTRNNLKRYNNDVNIPKEIEILTADICRISLIDLFNNDTN